jgi:hypothetical protein
MDEALRNLERAAAGGDPLALGHLQQVRKRANLCLGCGGSPYPDYPHCLRCQPLTITWDTYDLIKNQAEFLQEEDPELSEEEAFNQAANYDYDHEWEWVASELGAWIEELNPNENNWLLQYSGAGWQSRSGNAEVEWRPRSARKPKTEGYYKDIGNQFLGAVLPNTECTFTISYDGESFTIVFSHHDATGTMYHIVPGIPCEYCDNLHPTQEEADTCCFLCPVCEANYHSEEEANNCCFVCPHCKSTTSWGKEIPTVYRTKEEMEDCCHLCPSCEEAWDTIEEAQACCNTERRYRYNPDPDLERKLADLEDDYFEQLPHLRRKDLIIINKLREEMGLLQVNDSLHTLEIKEVKQQKRPLKPQIKIDKHEEARQIYQDYLNKIEEMKPQLEYSEHVIREVTKGRGMTPVMPLAIMGTGGGPILCDHCHKPIPLEGGNYHGVPANVAWKSVESPSPQWTSYILGGLVTFQHSNKTARFYHGYEGNPNSCYNLAMKELDAAEEAFNKTKMNTGQVSSLLRKFLEEEIPEKDNGQLVMHITNTLYGYDPGIGINRAT